MGGLFRRDRGTLAWLVLVLVTGSLIAYNDQQQSQRVAYLAAARDLPVGAVVADGDVRIAFAHPADFRPEIVRADELGSIRGALVAREILANEPVVRTRLASADGRLGKQLSDLLAESPRSRIIAWPSREVPLAGELRAGDRVDITMLTEDRTRGNGLLAKTIVQQVHILAVTRDHLQLIVPADLVEALYFARAAGRVEFSLAGPGAEKADTPGITFEQFNQRFIVPPGASPTPSPSPATPLASPTRAPGR